MKRPGLFDKLKNIFSTSMDRDPHGYQIFVRCARCDENITTRVDLRHDLSPDYDESGNETIYYCRKVLMGQKLCFQQIEVHLKFDERKQLLDRQIRGGVFISDEEYHGTDA